MPQGRAPCGVCRCLWAETTAEGGLDGTLVMPRFSLSSELVISQADGEKYLEDKENGTKESRFKQLQ